MTAAFVTIARTFELIDRVMLDEIRADIARNQQPGASMTQPASRFSDSRLVSRFWDITSQDVSRYIHNVQQGTSHTSSEVDVFAYLSDDNCITAWGWVHGAVLEYQGNSDKHHHLPWTQAKSRANDILDLARAVLETYDSDECRDQLIPGREGIGAGVEAKLRKLCSFHTIYCRPTIVDETSKHRPPDHDFYILFNRFINERRETTKAKRKANYVRAHQNVSKHSA